MTEKEEKEEIRVRAPSKSVTPPEKRTEKAAEKALEEERFGVLAVSRRVGKYFGASILVAGALLLCVFTYLTLTDHADWMMISPEITFLGFAVWILVSVINILGGFLLMGSE